MKYMDIKDKICKNCKLKKPLNQFFNQKAGKYGKTSTCKTCNKERTLKYMRSIDGMISKMYSHQKRRTLSNDLPSIQYTKEEFVKWIKSQNNFNTLYKNWVNSDYDIWKTPSIDRINDYLGYSFDNIQLVTWRYNFDKSNYDIKKGNNTKQCKEVYQYTKDLIFVKLYKSQSIAGRENNINIKYINRACNSKNNIVNGYVWSSIKLHK